MTFTRDSLKAISNILKEKDIRNIQKILITRITMPSIQCSLCSLWPSLQMPSATEFRAHRSSSICQSFIGCRSCRRFSCNLKSYQTHIPCFPLVTNPSKVQKRLHLGFFLFCFATRGLAISWFCTELGSCLFTNDLSLKYFRQIFGDQFTFSITSILKNGKQKNHMIK